MTTTALNALPPHVDAIRRGVIETAALPLHRASTLPPAAYTDEDYFRFEAKSALEAGWICLAHISQIKAPGDFKAIDLLGEPLLIIRDKTNQVKVLSRVCAHRAMDIMPDGDAFPREGHANLLLCPYHHWTYELDGRTRGCPHMERAEGFKPTDFRLKEFRSALWHGFIFVNLDEQASPLEDQYTDFSRLIAPWKPEAMDVVITREWECGFNWKMMVENWTESYHHVGAHSTTLNPIMPGENTWIEPEHPYFFHAHLPYNERLTAEVDAAGAAGKALPGFAPIPGLTREQRTEWGLYLGYPTFMFLTMPDRVLWYSLQPESAGRCRLQTMTMIRPENKAAPDYEKTIEAETKLMVDFHQEDMIVNTAVQRGLKSRAVVKGRLSHLEEPVWLIQRYVAARAQGLHPIKANRAPYSGPLAAAE